MSDDAPSLFDKLAQQRQRKAKPPAEPELKLEPETPPTELTKKKGRAKGKRSDPNYTQVGAYIPADLHKRVKRRLLDEDIDLSDLVTRLLEDWLND